MVTGVGAGIREVGAAEGDLLGPVLLVLEAEDVLGNEIHGSHGIGGIDEREGPHTSLFDQASPDAGIDKVGGGYGEPRLEAQGGKDLEGLPGLVRL